MQMWLDPALLWLWCGLAAVALIRPLAKEFPYVMGVALKSQKKKKKKEREREKKTKGIIIYCLLTSQIQELL